MQLSTSSFSSNLSGANLSVTGGSLTLTGLFATSAGTTNVSAGNLIFTGEAQMEDLTTTLTGGTLGVTGTGYMSGMGVAMNVDTGGTITDSSTTSSSVSAGGLSGTLNMKGGTANFSSAPLVVNAGTTKTVVATVNLDSGTLTVAGLTLNSSATNTLGTAVINSDGGTLQFSAANTITASTAATWNVKAGGAVFDTQANNVEIDQALVHDASLSGTDGGLTKNGTGTLNLASLSNSYNGNTTVNAGTLEIASAFLASTSTVSIANGALMNLNYSGTDIINALYLNGTAQGPGVYGVGQLGSTYFTGGTGTLTILGVAVPEPTTLGLLGLGAAVLLLKRRRTA